MQDDEFSKRGHERARVRSADAAVKKAVEHEAALERKAQRKADHGSRKAQPKAEVRRAEPKKTKPGREKRINPKELYGIKKRNKYALPLLLILFFLVIFAVLFSGAVYIYDRDTGTIVSERTIEAGETANLQMYVTGEPMFTDYVSCNLDFTTVNYILPQTIRFTVTMYGTNFPCVLNIVDTTAPTAEGIPQTMYSVDKVPPVEECVKNIYDLNDVTVEWDEIPSMKWGGNFIAKAKVTDSSGNVTIVDVPFSVTRDITPPVIEGPEDIEVFIGDTILYMENVTVTDDIDPNPRLEVDTSEVIFDEEGTYEVVYRATDFTGNVSETSIWLTLNEKPDTWVDPEIVYDEARDILNSITWDGMSDMEVALQITWWVRYNVHYNNDCDDSNWTRAAYDGFTKRGGNCYIFAMTAKALFDVAGIENMIIIRDPYIYNPHYWNYIQIDGEWYHCDSTPRMGYDSYFFMYTTDELRDFWDNGWNGYNFDDDLYPDSAEDSVQYMIDYGGHRVRD